MLTRILRVAFYVVVFLSLFFIDFALGNGLVNAIKIMCCRVVCFIKKSIREEAKQVAVSLYKLLLKLFYKYENFRGKDRIDELLQESKEYLRQINEILEKWRIRRASPPESTYLDEEPLEIKPLRLEVPILHMAIIETRVTTRSQPDRGDAGDSINFTDSALLSVTSLLEDDIEQLGEAQSVERFEDLKNVELKNRYL